MGCLQPTEIEKKNPLTWLFHRVESVECDLRNFSTLILAIGEDGLKSDMRSAVQRVQLRGRTTRRTLRTTLDTRRNRQITIEPFDDTG